MESGVADTGVDPEHVTLDQLALGGEQRAGDVAGGRPGPVGDSVRHHLPDRVENVGVGARIEDRAQEGRGQIGLPYTGREPGLDLGDGPSVMRRPSPHESRARPAS